MNIIPCAFKIRKLLFFRPTVAFLAILGGFHSLLSTHLTADLIQECSGRSMVHLLLHTNAKIFFITLKQLQTKLREFIFILLEKFRCCIISAVDILLLGILLESSNIDLPQTLKKGLLIVHVQLLHQNSTNFILLDVVKL